MLEVIIIIIIIFTFFRHTIGHIDTSTTQL